MIADKFNILSLVFAICFNFFLHADHLYQQYVYEIECNFAEQMKNELGLHWSGNMGTMRGKVEEVGMSFSTHRHATLAEARALELLVVEKLVQAINDNEKVRPYLDVYPFSHKRVTITVFFEGPNGRNSDGSIGYMFNVSDRAITSSKNHIVYYSHDPFIDRNVEILEEPYEEAVKLNAASPIIDPKTHQGTPYEEEMASLLTAFSKEMSDQYALDCWAIGGDLIHGIKWIGGKFQANYQLNQDEARKLIVEVAEKLLKIVNNNEKLKPYLIQYPFTVSDLKIRLCFEKRRFEEKLEGTYEEVTLDNGEITYFKLPPWRTKAREDPTANSVIESYQDALKLIEQDPKEFKPPGPSIIASVKEWLYALWVKFVILIY